ncbi:MULTISPECIES: hypothetical protein [unclassified Nonomuraea]
MKRKVLEYLPFLGIVLFICTTSWLAGRTTAGTISLGRSAVRR